MITVDDCVHCRFTVTFDKHDVVAEVNLSSDIKRRSMCLYTFHRSNAETEDKSQVDKISSGTNAALYNPFSVIPSSPILNEVETP
jgi:uncharacterized membrane protein